MVLPLMAMALGAQAGSSILGSVMGAQTAKDQIAASNRAQNDANAFSWKTQQESERYNAEEAGKQRDFQDAQAQREMGFQERMSSTAYQRQAADMEKAGINPITGFGGGSSTPTGAMGSGASGSVSGASGGVPPQFSKFNVAQSLASGAADFIRLVQGTQLNDAMIDKAKASAGLDIINTKRAGYDASLSKLKESALDRLVHSAKEMFYGKDTSKEIPKGTNDLPAFKLEWGK